MKPITPEEVATYQKTRPDIPAPVIEAVNELICENVSSSGRRAVVKICDASKRAAQKMWQMAGYSSVEKAERAIYDNRWLDIEHLYDAAGWNVKCDRPGYNETYDSFWVFERK